MTALGNLAAHTLEGEAGKAKHPFAGTVPGLSTTKKISSCRTLKNLRPWGLKNWDAKRATMDFQGQVQDFFSEG